MKVEVLNTGSELLLGNVVNTHLAYLGQQLFPLGLRIERQTTVPDGDAIRGALVEAFPRCDVLLVTGGLGPTTDDITREITAELLGLPLAERPEVTAAIHQRLERRGIPFRERMGRQAMAPEGAIILPNENGTAPGLYLPARQKDALLIPHLFLLPGPPRELRPMFQASVLPILNAIPGLIDPSTQCRIYHVVGMGESAVEEVIGLELNARGDLEVGYCARPNEVDFRLIGPPAILDEVEPAVLSALGSHIVSQSGRILEEVVIELLREQHATVATAESCTGGLVASRLTDVSGSSEVFMEAMVTYSNAAKTRALGVPADLIAANGAVSEPVARAMAEGARERANTRYALSLTGIAGPTGGTPEKPVGTVFIALAEAGQPTICLHEKFPTDRETFKRLASQAALDLLRRRISNLG